MRPLNRMASELWDPRRQPAYRFRVGNPTVRNRPSDRLRTEMGKRAYDAMRFENTGPSRWRRAHIEWI